jgi:hypothetical protein
MRRSVTFTVRGIPKPKGSMKAFVPKGWNRPVVTHDNAGTKGWESLVRGQAQTLVEVLFRLPRPKSLPRRVLHCVKKPDVDKLARLVLDGLTGVLFLDDAAVVDLRARKVYSPEEEAPGAIITVAEARDPDPIPGALFSEEA